MKNRNKASNLFIHMFFMIFSLAFLIPILIIISVSLSSESDIIDFGYRLIPKQLDFSAYHYVFANPEQIINAYTVTIFVTLVGTVFSVMMMLMMAYVLSRKIFRFRNTLGFYIFFTMLFNGGLIPTYILVTQYLNLGDSIGILLLNHLVLPWYIFILRTFIQQLPEEILESAVVDGASEFRIFSSLIIPLSKPAIATIGLLIMLVYWNDWMTSLIYISNDKLYPLQYLLQKALMDLQTIMESMDRIPSDMLDMSHIPSETARMALAIVSAGPMLFIMPFFQKYFVRGLTIGSVKS